MSQGQTWIEQELDRAHREGVTHPENLPYLLLPECSNRHGVLLIHGFGATPRELRSLADNLHKNGFTVAGIRLPGHGTSPRGLKSCRASEWLQAAQDGYQSLTALGLKVSICGLSTGALIALFVAKDDPVEKLVLLAPFLRLRHRLAPFAAPLSLLIPYQKRLIAAHERDFYYAERPLAGIVQINKLMRQLPRLLPNIKVPTLVLTSSGDATIAPGTAQQLYRLLGSRDKQIHTYGDNVPHVLTSPDNPESEDVLRRCVTFLEDPPKS